MSVKEKNAVIALDAFVPYQISVLADLIARRSAAITKSCGINLSQWRVLAAIADQPGRTANEVTSVTPMDKGIVSRAVKGLLELGLLIRNASQEDGRLAHLFLTPKGRRTYLKLACEIRKIETHMSMSVPKKGWAQMSSLLNDIVKDFPAKQNS
ncbi:MAG: winged helix-turn-helix transcriptional regulator [Alphaproteobacteria bacterium]|nr:winged helix-turn-helix transcriptional regulator [Marinicaulis sp.]NOX95163.1 winged helix-turn-helix transcriptional regulator [Alphaproteobacteria bacterium]